MGRNSRLSHVPSPEVLYGLVLRGGGKTVDMRSVQSANASHSFAMESRAYRGKHCISRRARSRRREAGLKSINLSVAQTVAQLMYEMSCFVKIKGRAKNSAIWIMRDPMSHCGMKLMNYLLTVQYKLRMLTLH